MDSFKGQLRFSREPVLSSQEIAVDAHHRGLQVIARVGLSLIMLVSLLCSYLEEAVMHLDHSDPITHDHMGSVMNQVRQKLFQFLQAEPHNSLSKPARRLMIMLQGLVTPSMP